MKPSYRKLFRIVLLPLCFLPLLLTGIAAEAAEYTRPVKQPPTDVDLVTREGDQKTIVVQVMDDDLFLGFRAYVEPETGVGPYWFEILWDRAIHFTQ